MISATRNGLFKGHMRQIMHKQARAVSGKVNTVILFVPQQEAWVIERFGKYSRTLEPGLNVAVPVIDTIKYVQTLKEIAIDVPHQSAITSDNVVLSIDGVLYLRIVDPHKASYGVEDCEYAVTQLAQTTMRSEIGKIPLDTVFSEREALNLSIVDSINKASDAWGIRCLRYEIRDIKMPDRIAEAMQLQVEAERTKRAKILESEGVKMSAINEAEGEKKSQILRSEAMRESEINRALGEANAILAKAKARAEALEVVSKAIGKQNGPDAVSLNVAEQYVSAFKELAKETNTVLLPSDAGNMSSMVTQALSIYKNLSNDKEIPKSNAQEVQHGDEE